MIRLPLENLEEGARELDRASSHYLGHVLHLQEGEGLIAFDPTSKLQAKAIVVACTSAHWTIEVDRLAPSPQQAVHSICWIQGIPKGEKCDAIMQDATELGATDFWIASYERSIVRLDHLRAKKNVSTGSGLRFKGPGSATDSSHPAFEDHCLRLPY
ncbi:RsmE family RNA methyltransferase [Pajaroellobacter abortibovis]|uniref:RsmE family RNA methyltransferase n=1 Tax=Pajaroellobacter abortibovis TaxID=1882918 RepID=UPI001560A2E8|nr:RsmE family RNA methyltransferase [Pajaroellobacter abortibovis]